ncbi:hypothetical protein Pan216_13850 [Planctomycetes bacterium Pan216]|uniref:phosphoglycolate phosphatase n=1 Tax=Kolteria novifilia TaxID=2527975 RepID=A0A518B0S4_9BACT|nr:hypothetical protein Pan216_13850 [Planctomycetes bacterium Pan216]
MIDFEPKHEFLVGIDSDGCAFDTMEVKHKECFIPNIIRYYDLASVSKYAREAAEFVNLYSKWRGINRFPALLMAFDLLRERPEVQRRGVKVPTLPKVLEWTEKETKLGNPALKKAVDESGDPELKHCLEWSEAVNQTVGDVVHHVPPFPNVKECLERLAEVADILVVSATPNEALEREWTEHGLDKYIQRICGQEAGTKKETLELAKKYPKGNAIMLGDAPGDAKAAEANNVLFFPILPGQEEESWQRFHLEGISRFLDGSYAGGYEEKLFAEFDACLPDSPPWN